MRELKFRQWLGNRFEYWGVNVGGCTFVGPCSGGGITAANTPNQQFTGLLDRNGREIYEGDVVRGKMGAGAGMQKKLGKDCMFSVHVYTDHNGFHTGLKQLTKLTGDYRSYPCLDTCEVIGNIYESPALAKGDGI